MYNVIFVIFFPMRSIDIDMLLVMNCIVIRFYCPPYYHLLTVINIVNIDNVF